MLITLSLMKTNSMKTSETKSANDNINTVKNVTDNKESEKFVDTSYNSAVTQDDLQVLGQDFQNNIRQDGGDDTQLSNRSKKVNFAGKDLDVPGRAAASKHTTSRLTDEENKLHSQGSSSNENLEEQSDQYTK